VKGKCAPVITLEKIKKNEKSEVLRVEGKKAGKVWGGWVPTDADANPSSGGGGRVSERPFQAPSLRGIQRRNSKRVGKRRAFRNHGLRKSEKRGNLVTTGTTMKCTNRGEKKRLISFRGRGDRRGEDVLDFRGGNTPITDRKRNDARVFLLKKRDQIRTEGKTGLEKMGARRNHQLTAKDLKVR